MMTYTLAAVARNSVHGVVLGKEGLTDCPAGCTRRFRPDRVDAQSQRSRADTGSAVEMAKASKQAAVAGR